MDEKLRKKLTKPLGKLMAFEKALDKISKKKPGMLIVVGDASIVNLLENDIKPDILVFDLMCKRKPVAKEWKERIFAYAKSMEIFHAKNPAGTISGELEDRVKKCILEGNGCVQVEGEDDLAALACVEHATKGAVVLYGQPDEGIVWIDVGEKMKNKAGRLARKIRES